MPSTKRSTRSFNRNSSNRVPTTVFATLSLAGRISTRSRKSVTKSRCSSDDRVGNRSLNFLRASPTRAVLMSPSSHAASSMRTCSRSTINRCFSSCSASACSRSASSSAAVCPSTRALAQLRSCSATVASLASASLSRARSGARSVWRRSRALLLVASSTSGCWQQAPRNPITAVSSAVAETWRTGHLASERSLWA